ncbi:P-type ATPase-like protein [Xylogone sp. PMI_703]|nr:P-type ATPase-like protein [Xylogone sp. PMI_703]
MSSEAGVALSQLDSSHSRIVTTSFLLTNIHCPSCVSHIQELLYALEPKPVSVSPSLITSWVTVQHNTSLPSSRMRTVLEDAGFYVADVMPEDGDQRDPTTEETGYLDQLFNRWRSASKSAASAKRKQLKRHLENCEQCRKELSEKKSSYDSFSKLLRDPAGSKHPKPSLEQPRNATSPHKSDSNLVVVDTDDSEDIWKASLAVGGMTCAACVVTITEELKKKPWIKNVSVNLIANSATVDFVGEAHKTDVVEAIEDIGYDATLDSVISLRQSKHEVAGRQKRKRVVEILVDGMYCDHCPSRILAALESLGDSVTVEREATLHNPIMKLSYTPHAPEFTIRDIMSKVSSVDEAIEASVYHPPTLQEMSQKIHARQQQRIIIRVIGTAIIAVPTLIIGIIYMSLVPSSNSSRQFLDRPLVAGVSRSQWALFIMATPVYFLCADVFHLRALKELRALWRPGSTTPILQRFYRFGSMNMLMSLGTSIAYISSVAQLIAAAVHPPTHSNNSAFYFDSVVFLTLFLLIGRLIESFSKSRTGDAVAMLGKLRPTEALLLVPPSKKTPSDGAIAEEATKGEAIQKIKVDLLEFGDTVKVVQGGSPPCDGTVIQGETRFDESSLTGEAKLVKKSAGDEVFAGTINSVSPISLRITGVAGSSMLDQIVQAVREGQTHRAPMERIADTLTGYFVPFVTVVAISTWIIWLSLGYSGTLPLEYRGDDTGGWVAWSLQFAIAVFVVACPCGLALAAPTALFVGVGLAAKHGILVKSGGEAFEKASNLDCVVFDKTGTLTLGGEPIVTDVEMFGNNIQSEHTLHSEKRILGMVSSVELNSSHTIAKALVSFCKDKAAEGLSAVKIDEIAGRGMVGTFSLNSPIEEEVKLLIGNEQLLLDNAVSIPSGATSTLHIWMSQGKSVALAAVTTKVSTQEESDRGSQPIWRLAAMFSISDPIRSEAPSIIAALRKRDIQIWMLSGDNYLTASAIGAQVGIDKENIITGVLPSQKAEKIQYLQKSLKKCAGGKEHANQRAIIAMVGDGINDSPALTTADLGIAIGSGSDIAISSAEFVLVSSNLTSLVNLVDLSRTVFRRIKFNFGWALVYNLIALPVAAGVLYPVVSNGSHVRLDPVWASLAMACSSISVVCSSLALRSKIPGIGFKASENP